MSIEDLRKEGAKVAKEIGVDKLFATTDGKFFKGESYAKLHATGKKAEVVPLDFSGEKTEKALAEKADKPAKAADIIAAIEKAATSEELEAAFPEGETRVTVVAAYDAKVKSLEEAAAKAEDKE